MLWNWVWKPVTILFGYFIFKIETTALSLNVREQIIRDAVLNPRRRDTSVQGLVLLGPSEWLCETVWCFSADSLFFVILGLCFVYKIGMLDVWLLVCYHYLCGGLSHLCLPGVSPVYDFNTVSQCTKLCSGASYMFIESVLFREYIGCQHQLVALVQWSFIVQVQSLTAIQSALAIQTRVPDHLSYHFGFLLECRWVPHIISIWWGQGCLPVLWCTSKTDYLKSGRHLKQMLGEMPSSNKFASMQQLKGKRYFCLFIQLTCFVL